MHGLVWVDQILHTPSHPVPHPTHSIVASPASASAEPQAQVAVLVAAIQVGMLCCGVVWCGSSTSKL